MNSREPGNLRRKADWGRVIALVMTVGGLAWSGFAYAIQWQKGTEISQRIEPLVYRNQSDIRINDAVQSARYEEVIRRLSRIENKIDHQMP